MTANYNADGSMFLIVSQPGGALLRVSCRSQPQNGDKNNKTKNRFVSGDDDDSGGGGLILSVGEVNQEEMATHQMRNLNVSSEIVGGFVCPDSEDETPYAISTLEGTLILARKKEILWSHQFPHQLFCLRKMDVDGDGRDEVVVSSWSGHVSWFCTPFS